MEAIKLPEDRFRFRDSVLGRIPLWWLMGLALDPMVDFGEILYRALTECFSRPTLRSGG